MMQYFKIFYDGEYDDDLFIVVPYEAFVHVFNLLSDHSCYVNKIEVFYE